MDIDDAVSAAVESYDADAMVATLVESVKEEASRWARNELGDQFDTLLDELATPDEDVDDKCGEWIGETYDTTDDDGNERDENEERYTLADLQAAFAAGWNAREADLSDMIKSRKYRGH